MGARLLHGARGQVQRQGTPLRNDTYENIASCAVQSYSVKSENKSSMSGSRKSFDIALKDLRSAFRSASAWVFMFGVPLMITGLFYLMFGSSAGDAEFDLPRTRVAVVNLDKGGPRLQASSGSIPGEVRADTLAELVVSVLESEDLSELVEIVRVDEVGASRSLVDRGEAGVSLVIPAGFSRLFSEPYEKSTLELYLDPTLNLGPAVVQSILNQFMDGISGVKILIRLALDQPESVDPTRIGWLVARFLETSPADSDDLSADLLEVRKPANILAAAGAAETPEESNPVLAIVGPIMGGMMIFYAFYTGASTGESILLEEERRTLQRLFTTPTSQASILAGKFLAVFLTVLIQIGVLLTASGLIFGIRWGQLPSVVAVALGIVTAAASFGVFLNSIRPSARGGGVIFGGVLTITGMIGIIQIFAMGSPAAARMGETVALLVPQGWAAGGLLAAMDGQPLPLVLPRVIGMLAWSAVFFAIGVWRFKKRFA